MSVFDLIVLVVLIALTLRGVMKGMVSQIVSVGSLFVCWIVASRFAFVIAPSIPAEEPWNRIGAMIVLFVVTMIAIRFAHGILEKKLKDWHLAGLNKYLGGGLGFLKGLVVCMVLTFFGVMLSETTREVVFQSKSGHHLASLIAKTGAFIPSDSCELLRTQIAAFNAKVDGIALPEDEENDDYMQMMMAGRTTATDGGEESPLPGASKVGDFLSRSSAVMDEIQSLKDDFNRETSGAVSLVDAVRRWWNGTPQAETAAVEENPPAVIPSTDKQAPVTLFPETKNPPSVEKALSPVNSFTAAPEAPKSPTTTASMALPPAPDETYRPATSSAPSAPQAVVPTNPAYREETLFRTAPTSESVYTPPTADELTALLPSGSTDTAAAPDPIASGAMAIPRSSFRLPSADHSQRSSDRLLNSTRTENAGSRATLFTPR